MFSGSIVALITPFNAKEEIDFHALERLLAFQLQEGTDGLVLCGSTGEGSLLTKEEKQAVFAFALEKVGGKMALIANTGTSSTSESVQMTQEAKKMGMDGAIAMVPYYCRPSEEGVYRHFSEIAQVGLPLIAYHNPARSNVKLSAKGLAKVAKIPNVVAIKEASGDLELAAKVMELTSCPLLSGDDIFTFVHMAIGFQGAISVIGNVLPEAWKEMIDAALGHEGHALVEARERFNRLAGLCRALGLETNPQTIKYAASVLGLCSSRLRLPLLEPAEETKRQVERELKALQTLPIAG